MSGYSRVGAPLESVLYAVPTTGQTVAVNAGVSALHLEPAGTLAALTITMPASPIAGQTLTISTTQAITALTITGTITGTLTTLGAAGYAYFIYNASSAKWFRCG